MIDGGAKRQINIDKNELVALHMRNAGKCSSQCKIVERERERERECVCVYAYKAKEGEKYIWWEKYKEVFGR